MAKFVMAIFGICILFSIYGYSNQSDASPRATIISKDINRIKFSISISNGLIVNNIIYKKELNFKKWLLQFKKNNGLTISRKIESHINSNQKMDLKEYSEVLEVALSFIKKEYPDNFVDQVQIDINLVNETWNKVIAITKEEAKKQSGLVGHKNKSIHRAIEETLLSSEQMMKSCLILKKYLFECNMDVISINPIAFKTEYLKKDWSLILITLTRLYL